MAPAVAPPVGLAELMTLQPKQVLAVSRVTRNMRRSGFLDQEISLVLRALYLSSRRLQWAEAPPYLEMARAAREGSAAHFHV